MLNATPPAPHPARQVRNAAGAVGATGFLALTWLISSGAEAPAPINLDAALGSPAAVVANTAPALDLSGGATPATPAPGAAPAAATAPPATAGPGETAAPETVAPETTAPPASAAPEPTAAPQPTAGPEPSATPDTATTVGPTVAPTTTHHSETVTTSGGS